MPRTYSDISTLVSTKLSDTAVSTFPAADKDYQIEECLKEFSTYFPYIILVTFKIESRYGSATSTSANNLVDATKDQFVAADATDEKVVHNLDDHTWAVVKTFTDAETLGLSANIFTSGEAYEIYNKRCTNKKQIYIGDMSEYIRIDHVEYPKGTKCNFKEIINGQVLELDVKTVDDSNPTLTNLGDLDVYVYFVMPHILSQLTDWAGKLTATAAIGATSLALTSLQSAGTIEEGEEFYVENQKRVHIVNADTAIASSAATLSFYPGLEFAAAATTETVTFIKSSLKPNQEEVFAELVAARLSINKGTSKIDAFSIGGQNVWQRYIDWGERRLNETIRKMKAEGTWRTKRRYSTD